MELRVGGFKRRGLVESLVGRGEEEGRTGANPPFGKIIRELHKKSVWRNQLLWNRFFRLTVKEMANKEGGKGVKVFNGIEARFRKGVWMESAVRGVFYVEVEVAEGVGILVEGGWIEEGDGDTGKGKERRIYLAKGPGEGRMGGVSKVKAYFVGKKTD